MKALLFTAFAVFSIQAFAVDENTCEFEYSHQITVHNGSTPSYYCYARLKRFSCPEGFSCGSAPAMMPQQCGYPHEVRKRRCIHNSLLN